jgi:hypothetical protein
MKDNVINSSSHIGILVLSENESFLLEQISTLQDEIEILKQEIENLKNKKENDNTVIINMPKNDNFGIKV